MYVELSTLFIIASIVTAIGYNFHIGTVEEHKHTLDWLVEEQAKNRELRAQIERLKRGA